MKRKILKSMATAVLSAALVFALSMPVHANAYATFYKTEITGDGVHIRKTGQATGTSLGLMYYGETIDHYFQVVAPDLNYGYIKRFKPASQYGYCHKKYIK